MVKVPAEASQPYYVKKWLKKDGTILFQLGSQAGTSNSIVQAVFPDKMVLVLSTKSRVVTQVTKDGDMHSYVLSVLLGRRDSELANRLELVKDMLVSILKPAAAMP